MALTRRAALGLLGGIIAGGGVIAGSGAFSGDANRAVAIQFADDSAGYLAMGPIEGDDRENVSVTESDEGIVRISVDNLNANARTVLHDLVAFTNNSPRAVTDMFVEVEDESSGADLSVTDIPDEIPSGEVVTGLGIVVDTRDYATVPTLRATIKIRTVLALEEA